MAAAVLHVAGLPAAPLDAAAAFHAAHMSAARQAVTGAQALAIVFEPAGHEHRAWRLAAVQALAREAAPVRVNGVAGNDEPALAEALEYLASAPGITGQLLTVDGKIGKTS